MKTNSKIIIKLTVIAILITMIVTFTHCGVQMGNEIGNGGGTVSSTISTPAGPKDEGQIINEIQVTTGIKNHEQILHTMGAVTGIDPYSNTSIMNVYNQVSSSLPTDNDIKIFSSTQQVAVTKLAAEFCFALTSDTAKRAVIWPGFNFGAAPATAFNNQALFIDQTIDAFWGPLVSDEEAQGAHQDLMALITMLNGTQTSSTATMNTVRGVCTSVLSSAYVTIL